MRGEDDAEALALHGALVAAGVVSPLVLGGAEEGFWADCDSASLAENRLGDTTDPGALSDSLRVEWRERATIERWRPPSERNLEACFWLLEGGDRIGTIALARFLFGSSRLRLSSLYVIPTQRRRGAATRAVERLRAVLGQHGHGLRLETCWTWQPAVRFYLQAGFWLRMWKRELDFYSVADVPSPVLHVDSDRASLAVDVGHERIVLAQAERTLNRLSFTVLEEHADDRVQELVGDAASTLSLALAVRGWPLIRSQKHWNDGYGADAGSPEALAYKIALWEAWERKHGFRVETHRIPGLEYPTWADFQARWARTRADSER